MGCLSILHYGSLAFNQHGLAGKLALIRQAVQHVNGPLPRRSLVDAFANVNRDTRHDAGDRAGPIAFDRPMDMTAEQARNLRVAADYFGERHGLFRPTVAIDIVITNVEGRVVDEKQGRFMWLPAKYAVEPRLTRLAEHALALTRGSRIERDKAHSVVLNYVVKKVAVCRQISLVVKSGAQGEFIVTVARNQVNRRLQRCQQLAQVRVLVSSAMLHGIPGEDNNIGLLPVDTRDTTSQAVGPPLGGGKIRPWCDYVGIADLGD